jgi:hypothetical protein
MTDFPFVLHCIKNYYLEKKQYWDNGGANEPNE